jgi:hypothetical protein
MRPWYAFCGGARSGRKLPSEVSDTDNPLQKYFEANKEGPGIYKWIRYFEIYHRHLQKFVGSDIHIMEIEVYRGGSLPMWRQYFGDESQVFGVDIEAACVRHRLDPYLSWRERYRETSDRASSGEF